MKLDEISSVSDLLQHFPDNISIAEALMEMGLIHKTCKCLNCGELMALRRRGDNFEWRCRESKTKDCSSRSIKYQSFFQNARLSLIDIMKLIIMWSNQSSSKNIQKELKISSRTLCDYKNFLREVCQKIEEAYPLIGGPNCTIECDETAFHVRKYGRGSRANEVVWVLGGYDRCSHRVFAKKVKNRSADILTPIIVDHVDDRSVIFTDEWKGYCKLKNIYAGHFCVNHSVSFVATTPTGITVHTNSIESYWCRLKKPLKIGNGTSEFMFDSYISEGVVRQNEGTGFYKAVLHGISQFYLH